MNKNYDSVRMIGIMPTYFMGPIPVGIIPDAGTQVAASVTASNAAVVIHTVTAGKVFYLSSYTFYLDNTSGGYSVGAFYVQNAVPAIQYTIAAIGCPNNDGKMMSGQFLPPLEIPAGWQLVVLSFAVNNNVQAFIHGYEA